MVTVKLQLSDAACAHWNSGLRWTEAEESVVHLGTGFAVTEGGFSRRIHELIRVLPVDFRNRRIAVYNNEAGDDVFSPVMRAYHQQMGREGGGSVVTLRAGPLTAWRSRTVRCYQWIFPFNCSKRCILPATESCRERGGFGDETNRGEPRAQSLQPLTPLYVRPGKGSTSMFACIDKS